MHKIGAVLLLILLVILSIFIGWEDEKPEVSSIPTENTTEIFMEKDSVEEDTRFKLKKKKDELADDISSDITDETTKVEAFEPKKTTATFTLVNTKKFNHTLTLSDQKVLFHTSEKPIVIVNLFATWCPPCIGEIPYLNDLQKKYEKDLFIIGVLTHDAIVPSELEIFMAKNQMNYFISNGTENDAFATLLASTLLLPKNFSIPLTVMYVEGEYFTHYEGSVPVEMIEYDIQQAKQQLKSR